MLSAPLTVEAEGLDLPQQSDLASDTRHSGTRPTRQIGALEQRVGPGLFHPDAIFGGSSGHLDAPADHGTAIPAAQTRKCAASAYPDASTPSPSEDLTGFV